MSLRHLSKVLLRAAHQAVRVAASRQPAPRPPMMPGGAVKPGTTAAAHRQQQGGRGQSSVGGLSGVSAEKKAVALETARKGRATEKAENVVHLVCWGPN